jgi:16S rRNA (cytosine967-C5)-methyltransferase
VKAPVILRTNTLKTTPEALRTKLNQEGYECEILKNPPGALRLIQRKNMFLSEAFKLGHFEIQDGASQMIAPLLELAPGLRVIDACAGAGGKTLHSAALMKNKGRIIALDIHDKKLAELKKRSARAGCDIIEMKLIEGSKTIKRLEKNADRLLLDVPCSGLGALRRNPDSKWKLTEERIEELRQIQADILQTYSVMLKPGGLMLYATCSILPSENEDQVKNFLANNKNFKLIADKHFWPGEGDFDGFYAAQIRRES